MITVHQDNATTRAQKSDTPKPNNYRTCMELGACQSRNPRCNGCDWKYSPRHMFAPGVIDGPYRRRRARWVRRAYAVLSFVLAVAFLAFLAGYIGRLGGLL